MIVISLLLIGAAAVMLVLGLWQPSDLMLAGSIGASVLAAVLLVVAVRRQAAAVDLNDLYASSGEDRRREVLDRYASAAESGASDAVDDATAVIPQQGGLADQAADLFEPPDEPAPQQVSPADAARVRRLDTEVLVVDGRPRYHLIGCVHLLGRDSEPLPVSEAIELGFTPCGLCEPDSALLADARRV